MAVVVVGRARDGGHARLALGLLVGESDVVSQTEPELGPRAVSTVPTPP